MIRYWIIEPYVNPIEYRRSRIRTTSSRGAQVRNLIIVGYFDPPMRVKRRALNHTIPHDRRAINFRYKSLLRLTSMLCVETFLEVLCAISPLISLL
jgi:hypothetical protein